MAVTTNAKAAIEEIARRYDLKEYAVAGRIFDWFVAQDDIYQRAVMGFLDGLEVDAAEAFLKRKARNAKLQHGNGAATAPFPSPEVAVIADGVEHAPGLPPKAVPDLIVEDEQKPRHRRQRKRK